MSCPLRATCPVHIGERAIPQADVWIMTPQALLQSEPGPLASTHRMRWLEFVQHHCDVLMVDEADRILGAWDHSFMPAQDLQDPEEGWAGVERPIDAAKSQHPARWHTTERAKGVVRRANRASQALDELLHRFYGSEGSRAVILGLGNRVWNEQSLLWGVAEALHGIEPGRDTEVSTLALARALYMDHLAPLMAPQGAGADVSVGELEDVRTALLNGQSAEQVTDRLAKWAAATLPYEVPADVLERSVNLFSLGVWAHEFSEASRFVVDHSAALLGDEFGIDLPDWGLTEARAIRSYLSIVPDMPMGNLVGFQWLEATEPTDSRLRMLWCRGLGRWLLHHLHDLLAPEGVEGPNVLALSATGWSGRSSLFNMNHPPSLVLEVTKAASDRMAGTKFHFTPVEVGYGSRPVRVSGAGSTAESNLEAIIDALFRERGGLREERRAWIDDILNDVEDPSRRRAMLVVNSTAQARLVSKRIAQVAAVRYQDGHAFVVPDGEGLGRSAHFEQILPRGQVETFAKATSKVVLVVPMLSIERGVNILNDDANGAFGVVMFLVRPHAPASDPQLALSLLAGEALFQYGQPVDVDTSIPEARRALHHRFRRLYQRKLSQPMQYSALGSDDRAAFVWNLAVRIWQTIGRGMRGGQPVDVYFVDAAFAPGRAVGDADPPQTSVLAALREELDSLCGSRPHRRWSARDIAIGRVVWQPLHLALTRMDDDRRHLP